MAKILVSLLGTGKMASGDYEKLDEIKTKLQNIKGSLTIKNHHILWKS
jgi:hypothetical protein